MITLPDITSVKYQSNLLNVENETLLYLNFDSLKFNETGSYLKINVMKAPILAYCANFQLFPFDMRTKEP